MGGILLQWGLILNIRLLFGDGVMVSDNDFPLSKRDRGGAVCYHSQLGQLFEKKRMVE